MEGRRRESRLGWSARLRAATLAAAVGLTAVAAGCGSADAASTPASPKQPVRSSAADTSQLATSAPVSPSGSARVTVETRIYVVRRAAVLPGTTETSAQPADPAQRERAIGVRLWVPSTAGRRPVILLALGAGGQASHFNVLATYWASAGFVVAAPQFPSLSTASATGWTAADLEQQPQQMLFVLDRLGRDPKLRIDADRTAVAGIAAGGATIYSLTTDVCCMDHRIKAAAIFDGLRPAALPGGRLVANSVPVLMLHCNRDPIETYQDDAVPGFARMRAPAWLVTLPCAENDQPYDDTPSPFDGLVERVTLDLWQATLQDDSAAMARISDDVQSDGRATVLFKG